MIRTSTDDNYGKKHMQSKEQKFSNTNIWKSETKQIYQLLAKQQF